MNNSLSNSTHWRTMRNLVMKPIMEYENITISDYDLNHIKCYQALGAEMQGSNVECYTSHGYSPFVYSDEYDIYEVPKTSNSKSYNGCAGQYLMFAHDTTNDYWLAADMEYTIDKSASVDQHFLISSVKIAPWGYYSISIEDYGHKGILQKMKVRN